SIGEHLAEAADVMGSGEETATRRRVAVLPIQRVGQVMDGNLLETALVRCGLIAFGQPPELSRSRKEGGIHHAEWDEQTFLEEFLVRQARDDLDDPSC